MDNLTNDKAPYLLGVAETQCYHTLDYTILTITLFLYYLNK